MNRAKRAIAATELLLLSPAALFMSALLVRTLQPLETARTGAAQQIVMWYAGRRWTLWVLLLALPLAALVTGCATLLQSWNGDTELRQRVRQTLAAVYAYPTNLLVATATLAAAGILAIVVLHMAAN